MQCAGSERLDIRDSPARKWTRILLRFSGGNASFGEHASHTEWKVAISTLRRLFTSKVLLSQEAAYICQGSARGVMDMALQAQNDLWDAVTLVSNTAMPKDQVTFALAFHNT